MAHTPVDDQERDQQEERSPQEGSNGFFGELKDVASEAALAVLAPVAKKAATGAAKYAVKKAPQLMEDTVVPMLEDAGGPKELVTGLLSADGPAGGLVSKLTGGDEDGGGDAGDGTGKGRRMPVQQAVDVAAPIDVVYDQWTQFEDYPKFMHRVERVEQSDDAHVVFHSKMWGINRKWEAEIVEQRPDERIVWKSVDGLQHTGVVTFHDLADRLTRIELNIDIDPSGPLEKIARGARFVKRAARGDLKRFKAYVEMHEDETGAWRGEIQDGDVVSESDEDYDDERYEDYEDEPEAEYEDDEPEPEAEYEDEGDEDEEEEEEEEREEKAPARSSRGRTRSKSASKSSRSRSASRKRGSSNGGDPKRSTGSKGGSSSRSRSRGSSKKKTSGSSSSSSSSRSRRSSSSSKGGSRSSKSGSSRSKSSARGRSS